MKQQKPALVKLRSDNRLTDSKGNQYLQGQDGVVRRANPKSVRGKSARRKDIKARREDRQLAAENLKA